MTNGAAVESRLNALEHALAAIERATAANEWSALSALEAPLADSLAALKTAAMTAAADRRRLEALLARTGALYKQLATRKAQIQPLLEAFVPADSEPPLPSP